MKIFLIVLTFAFISACHYKSKQDSDKTTEHGNISDAIALKFEYHFRILDSAQMRNPDDSIYVGCTPSIEFMEINTGINSRSDGTLLGKLEFYKSDLQRWHEWYDANNNK